MTAVLMVTGEDDLGLATSAIELGAYGYLVKPVRAGELLINVANALHRGGASSNCTAVLSGWSAAARRWGAICAVRWRRAGSRPMSTQAFQGDGTAPAGEARRVPRRGDRSPHAPDGSLLRAARTADRATAEQQCDACGSRANCTTSGRSRFPTGSCSNRASSRVAEFDVMKTHAELGHRLFADSDTALLRLAASIALTHHERWDGGGYPRAIAGRRSRSRGGSQRWRMSSTRSPATACTGRRSRSGSPWT